MAHDHHHDHPHHGEHHHHSSEKPAEMPLAEKLEKLVIHWIKHNKDHAETYRQWAEKARSEHMEAVAELLETVAVDSERMDGTLESALAKLKGTK